MSDDAPLVPCSGCRRHVRATEERCPFCGSTSGQHATLVALALATGIALGGGCFVSKYGGPPVTKYGGPPARELASPDSSSQGGGE